MRFLPPFKPYYNCIIEGLKYSIPFLCTVCDLIDSGIQGLVTALPCRSRQYIMSQADVFRLPHVSVSTESCETRTSGQYTLQTGANSSLLASLVTDVMWSMSWHSAGLILDDSVGKSPFTCTIHSFCLKLKFFPRPLNNSPICLASKFT